VRAPRLDAFINEVTGFPNIAEKGRVDSIRQLVAYLDRAIRMARFNKQRVR